MGCHFLLRCMKVKSESEVTQSCPTLSDPMDCSSPGSSVHGIFQARVPEWGAIAFSDLPALSVHFLVSSCLKTMNFTTVQRFSPSCLGEIESSELSGVGFISHLSSELGFDIVGSVRFSSAAHLCPTLCNPMNRSTPGLHVHHQLPEFTQTHVH